jgi:hypothetical protein
LLHAADYSLQANRKTREGPPHPDRDAQFAYVNAPVARFQRQHRPAVTVDTKKKELLGDFKNAGREWQAKGRPVPVRVHNFLIPEQGKAIPYGVYYLTRNEGWVSVGIDHDTALCGPRDWPVVAPDGPARLPAPALLITVDAGGSNGPRLRLWKWALHQFATRTGLTITVCHFPPGTSKWNKIVHRLFSHIAMNWRGKPLVDLVTIVSLIGETRTAAALRVRSEVDRGRYPRGVAITDDQLAQIDFTPHDFHGDWNYTIRPRRRKA